jgi:hypothetical protein
VRQKFLQGIHSHVDNIVGSFETADISRRGAAARCPYLPVIAVTDPLWPNDHSLAHCEAQVSFGCKLARAAFPG